MCIRFWTKADVIACVLALSSMLVPTCLAQEKPDPGEAPPPQNAFPTKKEDPEDPRVVAMRPDPELVKKFIVYCENDGLPIAVAVINKTDVNQAKGKMSLWGEQLAPRITKVLVGYAPAVEIVNADASVLNDLAKRDELQRQDPAGVASILQKTTDARLYLVIELMPVDQHLQDQQGSVAGFYRLLDLENGTVVTESSIRWAGQGEDFQTEYIARTVAKECIENVAKRLGVVRLQTIKLMLSGVPDIRTARKLARELVDADEGARVGADPDVKFSSAADTTQTEITLRSKSSSLVVSDALLTAAKELGLDIRINNSQGKQIIAEVGTRVATNEDSLDKFNKLRDDRRYGSYQILGGWTVPGTGDLGGNQKLTPEDPTGSALTGRLLTAMTSRLAPIDQSDWKKLRRDAQMAAIGRAGENNLAALLQQEFPDALLWVVSATPIVGADKGRTEISFTVALVDTRAAQTISTFQDTWKIDAEGASIERKANEYVNRVVADAIKRFGRISDKQELFVAGLSDAWDRDQFVDALNAALEKMDPGQRKPAMVRGAEQLPGATEAAVKLDIRTPEDAAGLSRIIRKVARDELGWPVQEWSLQPSLVMRMKSGLSDPEWFMLTETGKYKDVQEQLTQSLSSLGNPSITVVVKGSGNQGFAAQIGEWLGKAGLAVKDADLAMTKIDPANTGPADSDSEIVNRLRSNSKVDLALICAAVPSEQTPVYNCRLIDLRRGEYLLGAVSYPDPDQAMQKKRVVNGSDSVQVARYLAGQTLAVISRQSGKPSRLEVVVQNATDAEQLTALAGSISANLPMVSSVENLQWEAGVGGFFVVYKGSFENLQKEVDRVRDNLKFKLHDRRFNAFQWEFDLNQPAPGPNKPAASVAGRAKPSKNWAIILAQPSPEDSPLMTAAFVNDAQLMKTRLTRYCGYSEDRVTLLMPGLPGREATNANFAKAMSEVASKIQSDESVIVYVSSHGYNVGQDSRIATLDSYLGKEGTRVDEIVTALGNSKARQRLIIVDACRSGGMAVSGRRALNPTIGGAGFVTLAGCRPDQSSYADTERGNGFLTLFIDKALQPANAGADKQIRAARDVFSFLSKNVAPEVERKIPRADREESARKHGGDPEQNPTLVGQFTDDFVIAEFE